MADNISGASSTGSFSGYAGDVGFSASAIATALGSFNKASLTQATDEYQAQISTNNAQIDQWQASDAIVRGQTAEGAQQLKTAALYSTQRADMAASGVDIAASASSKDVLASTKFIGNVDAATIQDNALRQAWGYQVAETNATNAANFYSASAENINPVESAATSFLTSATSVASKWYTG